METKICRGPLHPEGVELPVGDFYIRKHSSHTVRGKTYHYYNKPQDVCKRCAIILSERWREKNSERCKEIKRLNAYKAYHFRDRKKKLTDYRNTPRGTKVFRKSQKRYRKIHREEIAIRRKATRDNLGDSYIKDALVYGLGFLNRRDISPEIINLKRVQLRLYRTARKQLKDG